MIDSHQLDRAVAEGVRRGARRLNWSGFGRPRSKSFATPSRNAPRMPGAFQFGQVAAEAETLRADLAGIPTLYKWI